MYNSYYGRFGYVDERLFSHMKQHFALVGSLLHNNLTTFTSKLK
jgi:hypothetical protein